MPHIQNLENMVYIFKVLDMHSSLYWLLLQGDSLKMITLTEMFM